MNTQVAMARGTWGETLNTNKLCITSEPRQKCIHLITQGQQPGWGVVVEVKEFQNREVAASL